MDSEWCFKANIGTKTTERTQWSFLTLTQTSLKKLLSRTRKKSFQQMIQCARGFGIVNHLVMSRTYVYVVEMVKFLLQVRLQGASSGKLLYSTWNNRFHRARFNCFCFFNSFLSVLVLSNVSHHDLMEVKHHCLARVSYRSFFSMISLGDGVVFITVSFSL